jgi:branched-chain amino acid transport system substrate-binding protein
MIMSASISDDEGSEHQMYAPKRFREARLPPAPQLRIDSLRKPPSNQQARDDPQQEYGGALEDEVRQRMYEREAMLAPQPPRRGYAGLMLISGLAIATACAAVLIVMFTPLMDSFWQSKGARHDTVPKARQAPHGLTARPTNAPAGGSTGIASLSEAQQAANVQKQPAQLQAFARHFEENPVQGVTEDQVRFGISAPLSGAAKELGQNMKLGIDAAFNVANVNGGVYGRQLRLVAVDDGYEPTRTAETMKQLYEQDRVFGIVGNVGTPTAMVALPYALERRMLFYGSFTGAGLLRRDPPDRYVFNYRASYAEETEAVVRYLVKVRRLKPEQIAVFAQQDSYGDAGFAGVTKAIRSLRGGDENTILRLNYKRNTVDIDDAVAQLQKSRVSIKAVIMVPTYRAAARFIEKTRDLYPNMIYTCVSFVGSTALANELMLLGQKYAAGVIVTQVVPALDGHSSVVLDYKSALAQYSPGTSADYVSLEGYLAATVLVEALKRTGLQLDTEKLVDSLEHLRDFDLGLGTPVNFGRTEHQALHKVWGTELDANGQFQPIDLE